MKIISKFHDYYDSCQAWESDPNIIYIRQTEILEQNLPYRFYNLYVKDNSNSRRKFSSYVDKIFYKNTEIIFSSICAYIAGKCWLGINMHRFDYTKENISDEYIWNIETLKFWLDQYNHKLVTPRYLNKYQNYELGLINIYDLKKRMIDRGVISAIITNEKHFLVN